MDFVKFCLINKSPLFFRRNYVSFGALSRFKCTACSNCLKSRSVLQIIQCLKGAVHHQRLIQSGFSHVSVTYSEPIDIVWRQHLSFYLSHYPIRDMNPLIGAITLNGNIYFHWNYVTRGFNQNQNTINKENRIYIGVEFRQSLGMKFVSPFQPEREFKVYKSCKCSQIICSRVH